MKKEYTFKVTVLGNSKAGKTTLVTKFVTNQFKTNTLSTIGLAFQKKQVNFGGNTYVLNFWDFAGEKRFRFLLPDFMNGAALALLLYDMSEKDSLTCFDEWLKICRDYSKTIPIIVVGSKADKEILTPSTAIQSELPVIKISSKTGENLQELLVLICESLSDTICHDRKG